jgi:hypothetical protein
MEFAEVRTLAKRLPGAAEAATPGTFSFTVRGKLFLRYRGDEDRLVIRTDHYERDHLLATAPEAFFIGDPIRDHPWVYCRLALADAGEVRRLVEDAWRRAAPRRWVERFDEGVRLP